MIDRIRSYFYNRREQKLVDLTIRNAELSAALTGIDYEMHPLEYDEIEAEIRRRDKRMNELERKQARSRRVRT